MITRILFESGPDYKQVNKIMEIAIIVGWVILILSWIIPSFIKDLKTKGIVACSLSALAIGIFVGHLLDKLY